jgi:hypothetical protein
MGRSATIIGLSAKALSFLKDNSKRRSTNSCKHCGHCSGKELVSKTYKTIEIWIFDDYELQEFKLKNGLTAREVVQAIPWESGPVLYTCLEIRGEKKFLHELETKKEVLGA